MGECFPCLADTIAVLRLSTFLLPPVSSHHSFDLQEQGAFVDSDGQVCGNDC